MPVEIKITPEDIAYAEKILLPEGKSFDEERRSFISNLNTIDLQAVPGSGKTTALLAKLLILERYLPFEDGSGILVISHTNAAVNEIKKKIGSHCPKLSNYPNFIGTIQSFVDQFLAIPYCQNNLKTRVSLIDSDRFKEALWNEFSKIYWNEDYEKPRTLFWGRLIKNARAIAKQTGGSENDICDSLIAKEVKDLYLDYNDEKIKFFRDDSTLLALKTNKKYQGIRLAIERVIQSGIISYEYAYKLAKNYCDQYPTVIELLKKRFKYVFVDEMQDMNVDQYNLLEKIFHSNHHNNSNFQRIGDKNQAIYNGLVKIQNIWINRSIVLPLNGSHRLSSQVGELVNCFALERDENFKVNGLGESTITPHIIIYDNSSIDKVITEYANIIKKYQDSGDIPINPKNPFKAIAWNTDWKKEEDVNDPNKIRLIEYHKQFKKDNQKPRNEYPTLKSYLEYFDKEKRTLEPIRKNVLNAILKILRLESIIDDKERNYTKRKLITYLRENIATTDYDKFNQIIYDVCINIIKENVEEAYQIIKNYIPELLDLFENKTVTNSENFINSNGGRVEDEVVDPVSNSQNVFEQDGIEIEIGTVHSSKGQTHTSTLYLESYYQRDYESTRLAGQFKGQPFSENEKNNKTYHQESTVMTYVGLSRPTHLLCVAIHKTRFDSHYDDINSEKWELINLTV